MYTFFLSYRNEAPIVSIYKGKNGSLVSGVLSGISKTNIRHSFGCKIDRSSFDDHFPLQRVYGSWKEGRWLFLDLEEIIIKQGLVDRLGTERSIGKKGFRKFGGASVKSGHVLIAICDSPDSPRLFQLHAKLLSYRSLLYNIHKLREPVVLDRRKEAWIIYGSIWMHWSLSRFVMAVLRVKLNR